MDNRTLVSEKCRLQLQKLESREKQRMASILRTSIQVFDDSVFCTDECILLRGETDDFVFFSPGE
jgi:hypothetical protein